MQNVSLFALLPDGSSQNLSRRKPYRIEMGAWRIETRTYGICTSYKASILTVECLFEINFTGEHIRDEQDYCFQGCERAVCTLNGKWNGQYVSPLWSCTFSGSAALPLTARWHMSTRAFWLRRVPLLYLRSCWNWPPAAPGWLQTYLLRSCWNKRRHLNHAAPKVSENAIQ